MDSHSQCNIELFGGIRVEQGKRVITRFRTQKTASLIAYLAYFSDRMHSREVLIDMLWPGAASREAGRTSLSVALSSLRSQLEPPEVPAHSLILADRQSIGLSSLVTVDTALFEQAIRDAEYARSRQDSGEEKRRLLAAIALYRDNFLPGYYEAWIVSQQERLAEQYRLAVRRLSLLYEEDGDLNAAIACAQRAVESDPSDEDVSQDLIRLFLKNDGNGLTEDPGSSASSNALKHFRRLEEALSETGHAPSAKTRALVAPLLKHSSQTSSQIISPLGKAASAVPANVITTPRKSASVFAVAATPQKQSSAAEITAFLAPTAPNPFPHPLTRFFGRQEEIAAITALLSSEYNRLITLTGPGGTGKTRIALEIARQERQRAQEKQKEGEEDNVRQVYFVSLIEAVTVDLLVACLRSALGVIEKHRSGDDSLLSLTYALKDRRTLLILDNFEQIAETGADLLEQLIERVPGLTCLVTSRQRLPILGEHEVPISPLPTPTPAECLPSVTKANSSDAAGKGEINLSSLIDTHPAVALFVDRAQLARTDFQITRRNASNILELVHRLEGLPLAIELAAARAQVLTPRQMMDRMGKRLDLLVSHRKVVGGRHQSLREALQFSYDLLSPQLRTFFADLAVFCGGFTAAAAEAVTESPIALDLLAQLCDASLIRGTEQIDGEIRFQMLESIREFANEKHQETDPSRQERLQAEARHLAFYARLAEEIDKQLVAGTVQSENLILLELDHDNIRAALRRALRSEPTPFTARESLRLIASLHNFWLMRSHFTEGLEWDLQFWTRLRASKKEGRTAVDKLDIVLLSRAMNGAGVLATSQGDYRKADRFYRHSLWLRRSLGDQRSLAVTLHNAGNSHSRKGDWGRARLFYERSLKTLQTTGDHRSIARVTASLGVIAAEQGDYDAARGYFEKGLDSARRFGDTRSTSIGLCNLGHIYHVNGDYQTAETMLTESLCAARELKAYAQAAAALLCLGFVRSARAARDGGIAELSQAELETGPQFLRIAVEVYGELNVPLPRYAAAEMQRLPAAACKANGFPFTGLQALQDILDRWLPEHAV
ncbi:MAG: tetratricopeptide repeat protein [Armatimonadota bacterium]